MLCGSVAARQLVSGGRWHRADGPALNTALSCCSVVQAARQGGGPEVPECSAAVGSGSWTPQCPQKLPLLPAPPPCYPAVKRSRGRLCPPRGDRTAWGREGRCAGIAAWGAQQEGCVQAVWEGSRT